MVAVLVVSGWWLILPTPVRAIPLDELRRADQLEREGQWTQALDLYEQILLRDRGDTEARERYHNCLRHIHHIRRHQDPSFQQLLHKLSPAQALAIYEEVLGKLHQLYAERDQAQPSRLFLQGVAELNLALLNEQFRKANVRNHQPATIQSFRSHLLQTWQRKAVADPQQARLLVADIAYAARRQLGIKPTVTIVEFICGACNSLDEYSFYLTPAEFHSSQDFLDDEQVGIGLEVIQREQRMVIAHVTPHSPADLAGLKKEDSILRVNHKPIEQLSLEMVIQALQGEPGTTVELEVFSLASGVTRSLRIMREALQGPSVLETQILEPSIGYLRLIGFQRSTPQEMEDAILQLKTQGMRLLILDLRGNPGGLFQVAVQLAERFLQNGVIVATQGQRSSYSKHYLSQSGMLALDLPLIVLVDGDTASSAEVFAAAMKDHQRATLVGQTTYGKASIQHVIKLSEQPVGGIRLTVARIYTPRGLPYEGAGITPHILVERSSMGLMTDRQIEIALQEASRLLLPMR